MFHHFHDKNNFIKQQDSISQLQFRKMITSLRKDGYVIIGASSFIAKSKNNSLQQNEIVLTFDDALKCQFEVALPVLEETGIEAFFFIHTEVFCEAHKINFEVLRDFRHRCFDTVEDFYELFFKHLDKNKLLDATNFVEKNLFLVDREYLSLEDKTFRACRDFVLDEGEFDRIHLEMMADINYDWLGHSKLMHMSQDNIKYLIYKKHEIGLHSHSHPTNINALPFEEQVNEYRKNKQCLDELFNVCPRSVSYPCGLTNDKIQVALQN